MTPETIVGVAIEVTPGRVFALPRPYRHHHVIRVAANLGEKTPIIGEQGFVTNTSHPASLAPSTWPARRS